MLGSGTIVSGEAAHAEGSFTTASGIASHAEGINTASGEVAHAEGAGSIAIGTASHAEGNLTISSGDFSRAKWRRTDTAMHMMKKGQFVLPDKSVQNQREFIHKLFGSAS
ncbi:MULTISPECIES: hypothetical protein [Bacillus]|nr:hypothetical protein [Bacillus pseudomycoides]EEM13885.1 hypothetical protein bpmyx0001_52730 [Bacillus pseudomycoides DSM 12442]MED1594532.1 hypothetical protein [Bacillus pseudomycoides]MED4713077.1 hypothetical protein [Bacillus pseudomycoides]OOR48413.1 hypothetical protein BLX05_29610 [Bacillus pseudomycoides]PDY11355.1 hypothetical protein COO16_16465 [Bacillus pseudomycoides]